MNKYISMMALAVLGLALGACEEESPEQIGDPGFYVRIPDTAPAQAYPNKELSFAVEVFAENGLEKIETRVDFQPLDGSAVSTFEDPSQALYEFSFTPADADLGRNLEFVIVAYDRAGFTYAATYSVEVVLEPVIIELELPESLPDTLEAGDVLDFNLSITSEDALSRVETIYNDSSLSGLVVEDFDDPYVFSYPFTYEVQPQDGGKDITFTFKATDVELKSKEVSYTLYIKGKRIPLPVDSYSAVTIGMQSNTEHGPFIDLETNTVYMVPDAKNNSGSVDLGTFRSGSSGINVFAPSYENAATFIYNSTNWGEDNLASWAARNATEIRRVSADMISEEDFNNMTDDELILEVFEQSGPSVDDITQVSAGEIVSFKTAGGKYGLMLIKDAVAASTGILTFDYKIQQ